jgi:hypothetical protein
MCGSNYLHFLALLFGMSAPHNALRFMYGLIALTAIAGFCFAANTPESQAQVSVEIGVAPECPYGYYDAAPYGCAPYGYYGPEWFT